MSSQVLWWSIIESPKKINIVNVCENQCSLHEVYLFKLVREPLNSTTSGRYNNQCV